MDSSIDFLSSVMAAKKKPTPKTAAKTASAASDAVSLLKECHGEEFNSD